MPIDNLYNEQKVTIELEIVPHKLLMIADALKDYVSDEKNLEKFSSEMTEKEIREFAGLLTDKGLEGHNLLRLMRGN